ncbi:MAG TPA: PIN domain-containing protein, partial [Pyrinomonadaceae bacterium]
DTNIWLERLLDQSNAESVGGFLNKIPAEQLYISDFSFHSVCVILTRLGRSQLLTDFIEDVVVPGDLQVLAIPPEQTLQVLEAIDKFNLDFDDGYQYMIAQQNELTIVTFDRDFDKTDLGRMTPAEILAQY